MLISSNAKYGKQYAFIGSHILLDIGIFLFCFLLQSVTECF